MNRVPFRDHRARLYPLTFRPRAAGATGETGARRLGSGAPRQAHPAPASRPGFTIIDTLVSIAVVATLLGILLPTFARTQEAARRVVCASNERQIGLGLALYADDAGGQLPPSVFLDAAYQGSKFVRMSAETLRLRLPNVEAEQFLDDTGVRARASTRGWDGLGLLVAADVLRTPNIFYCPSHRGPHRLGVYDENWGAQPAGVVGNYQYRGGYDGVRRLEGEGDRSLWQLDPVFPIVSDSLRSKEEANHPDGMNVLSAGLSVRWLPNEEAGVHWVLPPSKGQASSALTDAAWRSLDASIVRTRAQTAVDSRLGDRRW